MPFLAYLTMGCTSHPGEKCYSLVLSEACRLSPVLYTVGLGGGASHGSVLERGYQLPFFL